MESHGYGHVTRTDCTLRERARYGGITGSPRLARNAHTVVQKGQGDQPGSPGERVVPQAAMLDSKRMVPG